MFKLLVLLLIIALFGATIYFGLRIISSRSSSVTENNFTNQILQDLVGNGIPCDQSQKDSCRVDKVTGNYAKGIMPQAYWIALRTNSKWQVVITGNGIPTCAEIDKYSVPKEIYGNCTQASGQLRY